MVDLKNKKTKIVESHLQKYKRISNVPSYLAIQYPGEDSAKAE